MGKTTTAVNLGGRLGREEEAGAGWAGHRPPGQHHLWAVGVDRRSCEVSAYEVMIAAPQRAKEALIKTEFQNLTLLPSHMDLARGGDRAGRPGEPEAVLKNALAPIRGGL